MGGIKIKTKIMKIICSTSNLLSRASVLKSIVVLLMTGYLVLLVAACNGRTHGNNFNYPSNPPPPVLPSAVILSASQINITWQYV